MLRSETSAPGARDSVSMGGAAAGWVLRLKKAISFLLDGSGDDSDYQIYSARKADIGSIRMARLAGTTAATQATATSSTAVPANVRGSAPPTPKSSVSSARPTS